MPTKNLCVMCSKKIGKARLEALPKTTVCVACASASENAQAAKLARNRAHPFCPTCGRNRNRFAPYRCLCP